MYEEMNKELCVALLNYYQQGNNISTDEIENLSTYKSDIYGLSAVHCFSYKGTKYYTCDDQTLDDNPQFLKDVLSSINHLIKGGPVKNPHPQSDGALYAGGLGRVEYYLWKDDPKVVEPYQQPE